MVQNLGEQSFYKWRGEIMGEENGRRESDTKLALIEQKLDMSIETLEKMEKKLDKYNGTRERIDNLCLQMKEHKSNHWQMTTLSVAIASAVIGMIFKFM